MGGGMGLTWSCTGQSKIVPLCMGSPSLALTAETLYVGAWVPSLNAVGCCVMGHVTCCGAEQCSIVDAQPCALCVCLQACLDNYKQQLVGDPIIHTHLTALYGEHSIGLLQLHPFRVCG